MAKSTVSKYYDDAIKTTSKARKNAISDVKTSAANKTTEVNSVYDGAISKTKIQGAQAQEQTEQQYQRSYDMNAVAQLVAERQLKEKMANAGLTQSGLNATQQTALAVNKMNADRSVTAAKNAAKNTIGTNTDNSIFSMESERASKISDINSAAQDSILSINQSYDQNAMDSAVSQYNAEVEAKAKIREAEIEADNKIKLKNLEIEAEEEKNKFQGWNSEQIEVDEDGNPTGRMIYTDAKGHKVIISKGSSPYSTHYNPDVQYGTMGRSYQPDNISGSKLGVIYTTNVSNGKVIPMRSNNGANLPQGKNGKATGYKAKIMWANGILSHVYATEDGDAWYVFNTETNTYDKLTEEDKKSIVYQ